MPKDPYRGDAAKLLNAVFPKEPTKMFHQIEASKKLCGVIMNSTAHALCPDPFYYTGRGNTRTDLDSKKLGQLHNGIKQEYGADAAKSFVAMVKTLTQAGDMSATTFLVNLAALEARDWSAPHAYYDASASTGFAVDQAFSSESAESAEVIARCLVFTALANARFRGGDSAVDISGTFLSCHYDMKRPHPRYRPL